MTHISPKLLLISAVAVVLASVATYSTLHFYRPKSPDTKIITVTKTAPARTPSAYHIGDAQTDQGVNIVLSNVYATNDHFVVDFTITNNNDYPLGLQYLEKGTWIYIDKQGWRASMANSFSEIPSHTTRTGHFEYAWSKAELVDTVMFYDAKWYL